MLKILWMTFLLIVTNQSHAKSKCEFEWKQFKSIQSLLRQKSTEYLRRIEHEKHNEYQNCRKGKTNKTYRSSRTQNSNQIKLENIYSGKKQKAWLKYYRTPQNCKSTKSEKKFKRCLEKRNDKASHFERVWSSKQR
jgi:hypothetical protein